MEQMPSPVLRTAIGNYGHTTALKDGTITSPTFDLEHVEVSPVPTIFRRMVRGLEFDVAEMALATCLCARAHGRRFTGPLPYGFESSRKTLETFIRYNVEQGVIPQAVAPEDLFVPETLALV